MDPQPRIRPIGEEACAHFQDATSSLQFQCILLLMRDGGLSVGEVLGLHIQDLEFHCNGGHRHDQQRHGPSRCDDLPRPPE